MLSNRLGNFLISNLHQPDDFSSPISSILSFASIYISPLHYLTPSAHQTHASFDGPEDADKSCLFGLELFKLVWGKLSVILSGP